MNGMGYVPTPAATRRISPILSILRRQSKVRGGKKNCAEAKRTARRQRKLHGGKENCAEAKRTARRQKELRGGKKNCAEAIKNCAEAKRTAQRQKELRRGYANSFAMILERFSARKGASPCFKSNKHNEIESWECSRGQNRPSRTPSSPFILSRRMRHHDYESQHVD